MAEEQPPMGMTADELAEKNKVNKYEDKTENVDQSQTGQEEQASDQNEGVDEEVREKNENVELERKEEPKPQPQQNSNKMEEFANEKGYDWVDFSQLPGEIRETVEPRFHRLYRQLMASDANNKETVKMNMALAEKIEKLQETTQKQLDIHSEEQKNKELADVRGQIRQAADEGDGDRVLELTSQLVDVQKKYEPKEEPTEKPEEKKEPTGGGLSEEDAKYVTDWTEERDDLGNPVRPWIQPGHPLQKFATDLALALMSHPNYEKVSIGDVLSEVEKIVNAELSSRTTPNRQSSINRNTSVTFGRDQNIRSDGKKKTSLTPREQQIAINTIGRLPGISDEEAIRRYMKQKEASM